jgi:sialate O-acetylesterase
MKKQHIGTMLVMIMFLLTAWVEAAELAFSRHYSDNMVLQRDKPVLIRGFANPDADVTVTFASQIKKTKAGKDGEWTITLDPMSASIVPLMLKASSSIGNQESTITNVLVGDVFLIARQTTIDVSLGRDKEGQKAAGAIPTARVLRVRSIPAATQQKNLAEQATSGWEELDKNTALMMSGAAFYLARDLAANGDVPIGLIDMNMGPHFAIAWLSNDALLKTGDVFGDKKEKVENTMTQMEKRLSGYSEEMTREMTESGEAYKPPHPLDDPRFPAAGYNAVLYPMRGLSIKAILLQLGNDYPYVHYQRLMREGKDTDRIYLSYAYKDTYDLRKWCIYLQPVTTPRIPMEWRRTFGDMELPIGWITPPGSDLATMGRQHQEMRELQRHVAARDKRVDQILAGSQHIPFSAQPADEKLVADRCAAWVSGSLYQKNSELANGHGPVFDRVDTDYSKAQVFFQPGTAKGLRAEGDALSCFEVAGTDLEYFPAHAVIDGETVRLESDTVGRILTVRYNWREKPNQGLVNAAGLPALPFSTDGHEYPRGFSTMGEEELPEEFMTPVCEWKSKGAVIVNGSLDKEIGLGKGEALGPTGLRVQFYGPNLYVLFAYKGSPADGKILRDDMLYAVNGKRFGEDMLGEVAEAITQAETEEGGGRISFDLVRDGKKMTVDLQLEVLGSYSPTSPYDCQKTDRIVANAEAYIAERGGTMTRGNPTFLNADALFLLAAGSPAYQGLVRRHMYSRMEGWDPNEPIDPLGYKTRGSWVLSADALLAAEYYLSTGDTNVMAFMQYCCDSLNAVQYRPSGDVPLPVADNPGLIGGWRHNFQGTANFDYPTMPAIGVPASIGYHLTKEAGVKYDFIGYDRAVNWFLHNGAKVGHIQYGAFREPKTTADPIDDDLLRNGKLFNGNGCVGGSAVLFDLRQNGPVARICSLVATYSYNNTGYAHGGNFWANYWTPLGAKVHSKKAFQTFMKGNRNFQENHRMFNHARDQGNAGFGVGQFLAYVAPKERLRILGAHESVFGANPPNILLPALRLYRARKYAACEQDVTRVIETGTLHLLDLQKAEQLKAQVMLLQESINHDLAKVQRLVADNKLYEASLDIPHLTAILPVGHPELNALVKTVSDPARVEILEQDKVRYGAHLQSLKPGLLVPSLPEEAEGTWKELVSRVEIIHNKEYPDGKFDKTHATRWRMKVVESFEQAPEGWAEIKFDDSSWTETTLPISWYINHGVLLRANFEIDNKRDVKALRLRNWAFRQQNMRVYLNGKLIAKITPSGAGGKEVIIPLNDYALKMLKNGQNTLAATYRNTWRWGRYARNPETARSSSVYNHGVHLILEAQD